MAKNLEIGALMVNKKKFNDGNEKTFVSLALGRMKNKNPHYNLSVTLTVKDNTGRVVHQQENGYLNLIDPRTRPDELLTANLITEDQHASMKERAGKIHECVKYSIEVPRSGN